MPGRFPLVPVALGGDPFCEDGFCGSADLPFDTTLYNYARFIGTKIGRYDPAGAGEDGGLYVELTSSNAIWLEIGDSSSALCYLTCAFGNSQNSPLTAPDMPGSDITNPTSFYQWAANFDVWVVNPISSFPGTLVCRTIQFKDGIRLFDGNDPAGFASNMSLTLGEMYATCRGTWQFKRSATQPAIADPPDAEWIGNTNAAWFNPEAAFDYPFAVPPYTLNNP